MKLCHEGRRYQRVKVAPGNCEFVPVATKEVTLGDLLVKPWGFKDREKLEKVSEEVMVDFCHEISHEFK